MRYFILFFILLAAYLLIHIYYSFCQDMSMGKKVVTLAVVAGLVMFAFAMHPAEWLLNYRFPEWLKFASNCLTAFFITLAFVYLLADILKFIHLYPAGWKAHEAKDGLVLIAVTLLFCGVGFVNNIFPMAMKYDIATDKKGEDIKIAFISDLHIGSFNMTPQKLTRAVGIINDWQPDMVFLGGDIFDGKNPLTAFDKGGYAEILKRLKPPYGVFAVTGNHEYYMQGTEESLAKLAKAGVVLLRDDAVYIKPLDLYIVGREDKAVNLKGKPREDLKALLPADMGADSLVLALVHNPDSVKESAEHGVDVQMSGHTHNGQLFPLNFILKLMYEKTWGVKEVDGTVLFVSSGLGMWGPPVRTSAVSEVALVTIKRE